MRPPSLYCGHAAVTAAAEPAPVTLTVEQRLTEGLPAAAAVVAPLVRYLALLEQWNRAYNLTSVTGLDDMVVRHILDSATVRPFLAGPTVLDAGTGAGLPGIPLALLEPGLAFTLLDSVGKKMRFLHEVVSTLGLTNVRLVQARLEDWRADERFSTITCRALGTLATFASLCGRFLAPGGRLVAMKGQHPAAELRELPAGWRASTVERVRVRGLDAERHIVVLER